MPRQDPVHLPRLLVIDDDVELCDLVGEFLRAEGFDVTAALDPERGIEQALSGAFEMILLDVMMPKINGFEVLRRIRAGSAVPVIMLTARGEEVDRIVGLELGADDYMPKPFSPRELVARIHAVRRRAQTTETHVSPSDVLTVDDITIDPGARSVRISGVPVELTGVEFTLLSVLLHHAGSVVERDTLFRDVLDRRGNSDDRAIDTHVSNLRRKLGPRPRSDVSDGQRILAVRGIGYIYTVPGTS